MSLSRPTSDLDLLGRVLRVFMDADDGLPFLVFLKRTLADVDCGGGGGGSTGALGMLDFEATWVLLEARPTELLRVLPMEWQRPIGFMVYSLSPGGSRPGWIIMD